MISKNVSMGYQKLITNGIKRLRSKYKLTQEQFAEKICMSVQGYRNIEHNRYLPTAETIDKICKVFETSPVELLLPDAQNNLDEIKELINIKLNNCKLEKLIKINKIIDIIS